MELNFCALGEECVVDKKFIRATYRVIVSAKYLFSCLIVRKGFFYQLEGSI